MTNEFMRFLITHEELNKMALVKHLVTPTTDLFVNTVYEPFGRVPAERVLYLSRSESQIPFSYRYGTHLTWSEPEPPPLMK